MGRFHAPTSTPLGLHLAVTMLTLLCDGGHSIARAFQPTGGRQQVGSAPKPSLPVRGVPKREIEAQVCRPVAPRCLVPRVQGGAHANGKRPGTVAAPGRFVLSASYAAICLTNGDIVLTSILRGKAAAATGAVISNTPFTYSAVSFSTFTPSGSVSVRSNTP